MLRNRGILIGAAAFVMVIVAGAGWYFFIRGNAPPPLTLDAAMSATTTTVGAAVSTTGVLVTTTTTSATTVESEPSTIESILTDTTETSGTSAALSEGSGEGQWQIDPTETIVGYRIEEELAGIGGNTVVGRTSGVSGSLELTGATIDAVDVLVDMTTIQSDDSRRDGQMRRRGLETNSFPEARFSLTEPIDLGASPAVGETISVTAVGELTLHGVIRKVEVPLEGRFVDGSTIVVVGAAKVVLADYEIEVPVGFSVLSVADSGLFEFQLAFRA